MNAYYYTPQDLNIAEFAPGYFRLEHPEIHQTFFPDTADCWALPCDVMHFNDRQLLTLPYLKDDNQHRHILFSLGEHPERPLPFDPIAFRTDFNTLLYPFNTRSMTHPWPVEDLEKYVEVPSAGFDYDIHAQLWASTSLTPQSVASCVREGLHVHNQQNNFFYGTLETQNDPRLASLRLSFLESMQRSRLVLVPRSRRGVNRYRFYEALSMGRIPVLLCDDCILPFADAPEWNDCMLRLHEQDVSLVGVYLKHWLQTHDDAEIVERGRAGRKFWKECLAPAVWEQVWGETVYARIPTTVTREVLCVL